MSQETQKQEIKLSTVLEMLGKGVSRKEIAAHYGLSQNAAKNLIFSHPKIKNRKTIKSASDFVVTDDLSTAEDTAPVAVTTEAVSADAAPVQETAAESTDASGAGAYAQYSEEN